MNFLLILPRALWKLWFILNFLITLILLYPFFFVLLSSKKWFGTAFLLMRGWAKWLCYGAGIFPSVKYELDVKNIPQPCVFVSNHCSYLDILLSYVAIPHYFIFVGKQELDKAPLFRIFFRRMNILVNRKSTVDSHRAFVEAAERIERGENVFIFPEATISSNGTLIPFKNGAFKLAIDKQVPVVPLVFPDNWKLMQSGGFLKAHGKPGIARIIIRPPIHTHGMTNEDLLPLREKTKHSIQTSLNQHQ
ncbi:MAG: 1-acyl-sn-glycerol-3-phosphate acyltransferase [Bacteroidetes bacterium]|nr:1-acyl-sn-glycerol-3-phosphate acyltransferase [Bacteroidota bacterium]